MLRLTHVLPTHDARLVRTLDVNPSKSKKLEVLEVSIASVHEMLPAILSFSNTYNHEVIITAKRLLIVEHKLNSVAEIRTEYIYTEGWKKKETNINEIKLGELYDN